jgi:endogenous inhibitor of DNA gyrase (YacG/DUF329 family)
MGSRKINCARCGKETIYGPENPYRPFCSERCRLIDLGQWATESYRIESQDAGSIQELAEALDQSSGDESEDAEGFRREPEEENKKN